MSAKLVVIGGGAAGFFCAVNAARMNPSLEVLLLEKSGKLLSKVRVSGGGRCNLTHACFDMEEMSRQYPRGSRFVRKAFHRFFTTDTIKWFEERGVPLKTEADGRMFPASDNSESIISCLLKEVSLYGVDIRMNTEVIQLIRKEEGFQLVLNNGKHIAADYVCVACGGYPKTAMFDWLQQTGHFIETPVPSLFTFNIPGHPVTGLMGVSVPAASVRISGTRLEETAPLLITHWGLSGPAVLKLSARGARELAEKNYHFQISVNWLPGQQDQQLALQMRSIRQELAAQKISLRNPFGLPQRLWDLLLNLSGIDKEKRWADLPMKEQNKLVAGMVQSNFEVKGKTTFKEEFVTAGGISLSGIDVNTMQSKKINGLFFAGEIMDVDGVTGGFNFQHAWTSGFIAACSVAAASPAHKPMP